MPVGARKIPEITAQARVVSSLWGKFVPPPELAPERVGGASSGWLAKLMPPPEFTRIYSGGLGGEASPTIHRGVYLGARVNPDYTQGVGLGVASLGVASLGVASLGGG